ncbi:MAG TPA: ATP-binding protein [Propionibacteriaceae bacterium]|nr:ATP-binding protein [Propionibacteriaceae bacterium]
MRSEESVFRSVPGSSGREWLSQIAASLADAWESAPFVPEDDRLMFELAVLEVAGNIVVHSVPTPTWYLFELDINRQRLAGVLKDNAGRAAASLDTARMPDETAEGGRGLALAKAALDVLQYDGATGNCWTLVRLRD